MIGCAIPYREQSSTMPSDTEFLVTCTNGSCTLHSRVPLIDLPTFRLIHTDETIPTYDEVQAGKVTVACPSCARAGREGTLVYVVDHLRKAPPDIETVVPAVFDGATSLWKRAQELATVTGQIAEYKPSKLKIPTGVRLELRPYGGYLLRFGNNDESPQYDRLPTGQPAFPKKPRYIRELKHDLIYLAYYGSRERKTAKGLGGVSVFEAMTIGAVLALKFDLSFFYGVPTTTDIGQATVSDSELRSVTLETFSKPIYFEPRMLDNPIKPIAEALIYPLGTTLMAFFVAHERIGEVLDLVRQSRAPELSLKKAAPLREKARKILNRATSELPKEAAPLKLGDLKAIPGERKERALQDVVAHPYFAASRTRAWPRFEQCLRAIFAAHTLRSTSHVDALEKLVADSDAKLAKAASAALERYKVHLAAVRAIEQAEVDELRRIIGGLPETFEPYRTQMHDYAVVDHATAFYIKAILAGVKIGSDSGKVIKQPGRKLVYRMPEGGIKGEPETLDAYADLVIKACEEGTGFSTPPLIMLERQKNESGFRATDPVAEFALAAEERKVYVPTIGIDWHNWGRRPDGARTNYGFSELFTNSVGVAQSYPGYLGPIVLSRGVGGGQVTTATILAGVTIPGRAQHIEDVEFVAGIPVPNGGEMPTPGNWIGSTGSIERARNLLRSKFDDRRESRRRGCTYGKVQGGKKYDCAACLARFDLVKSPELVWNRGGGAASYHCSVDASRWEALFGEKLASDDEAGRTEFPCSWLRAVQRYAGTGPASFARILATAREVVEIGKVSAEADAEPGYGDDEEGDEAEAESKPGEKKKPKLSPATVAIRSAFKRVRKRL
jgi:hypothetical protein